MRKIGHVKEIWRYPVKSMGGERLSATAVGPTGVAGDRGWAVRDDQAGEIRGAKKLPSLLLCAARYLTEPTSTETANAVITLPDGTEVLTDAPDIQARLSDLVGRAVSLWPLRPATDAAHYRRGLPDNPDMMAELREIFGRTEDEPLPDLSFLPTELFEYTSPPGTYFDVSALHLLSTASLSALRKRNPAAGFDVRRFRPNFLIEPSVDTGELVDTAWVGKRLRIGAVEVDVTTHCPRCVMTTLPQAELAKDPSVLRTIVRDADQNLGVYATVAQPGRVGVGDAIEIVEG